MEYSWKYGISTHAGLRKNTNEDRVFLRLGMLDEHTPLALAIIADGMGGMGAGDHASSLAVEHFIKWWNEELGQLLQTNNSLASISKHICQQFQQLNDHIVTAGKKLGVRMGTTLSTVLFVDDQFLIHHVGDSRIYNIDLDRMKFDLDETQPLGNSYQPALEEVRLTKDHTWVSQQIAEGKLSEEQAYLHPKGHILTQCIGVDSHVDVWRQSGVVRRNQLLLLCSDGLHGVFQHGQLAEYINRRLRTDETLQEISDALINEAIERQSQDNISVLLLQHPNA